MNKFVKILEIWTKVSLYGILGILLIIVGFMLFDFLFHAGFGYKFSDLLIIGGIAAVTIALFFGVRGMVRIVRKP